MKPLIISDFIAVDYLIQDPEISYYFLSHAHLDRCPKLNLAKVYCSPLTAKVLPVILNCKLPSTDKIYQNGAIEPLELNVRHEMDGFFVTLIDANHVIGSVMFLFEGPKINEGVVLCTGDFRADSSFYADIATLNILQMKTIDLIYLDDTYLEVVTSEFPTREDSLKNAVEVIRPLLDKQPSVIIPVSRLGHEQFLTCLAEELKEKIFISDVRMRIMKILGGAEYFTDRIEETRIRTCCKDSGKTLFGGDSVIVNVTMLFVLKGKCSRSNQIDVEYSDHCSPNEIYDFLRLLRFRRVVGQSYDIPPIRFAEIRSLSLLSKYGTATNNEINVNNLNDMDITTAFSKRVNVTRLPLHQLADEMKKLLEDRDSRENSTENLLTEHNESVDVESINFLTMASFIHEHAGDIVKKQQRKLSCVVEDMQPSLSPSQEQLPSSSALNERKIHPLLDFEQGLLIKDAVAQLSRSKAKVYRRMSEFDQFLLPDEEAMRDTVRFDAYKGNLRITDSLRRTYSMLTARRKRS